MLTTIRKAVFWGLLMGSIMLVGVSFEYAYAYRGNWGLGGEIFTIVPAMLLVWGKVERMLKAIRGKNIEISRLKEENKFLREERKEVR
jgi:hypothetical protein